MATRTVETTTKILNGTAEVAVFTDGTSEIVNSGSPLQPIKLKGKYRLACNDPSKK